MVVEARYAAGSGVLLGVGAHWLLMTDPGDDAVLDRIWQLLSAPVPTGSRVAEDVLSLVVEAHGGRPVSVALVDLTPGTGASVARGSGRVRRLEGGTHVLTLDDGEPDRPVARRLVAGVAAASLAELRPVAGALRRPTTSHAGSPVPHAVPEAGALIDGIPDEILGATGPDGPPPPRRRAARDTEDTGPMRDTTEPDPHLVRVEEGVDEEGPVAPTAPPGPEASPAGPDDHDGSTVVRPHLAQDDSPSVLAVSCPQGHLSSPSLPDCRTCHQRIAPQEPFSTARPALGGLRLPTGEVVPLDRGVVLGRKPAPVAGGTRWPHLVHLPRDYSFVSRLHLQVELDGWDVVARDLDSRGGTTLRFPGREPVRMRPHDAYVLERGSRLDLAEVYEIRFETGTGGTP